MRQEPEHSWAVFCQETEDWRYFDSEAQAEEYADVEHRSEGYTCFLLRIKAVWK